MRLKRLSKIMEIIDNFEIETQEELADMLRKAGIDVTQATISRDIRELKLTKASSESGKQKYVSMAATGSYINEKQLRVFNDAVLSIDSALNIIVIKTLPGMAMACGASIDAMEMNILGSLAGDDTLLCVVRSEQQAQFIVDQLKSLRKF